jgi:branched-chain amino acid transport system substrate-binding protein
MNESFARIAACLSIAATFFMTAAVPGAAQKAYGPGVSDTEIKIGNTAPYSGPASALSLLAKTQAAYFKMINAQGGVRGRQINFISYDDGYSPPKTVEQVRKLVEGDEVLLLFSTLGTATNLAVQRYANQKQVPHIFIASGASKWADPTNFFWSMGWQPNYRDEARIYANYVLKNHPGKKVGVLYQNDDFGKDFVAAFKEVFGSARQNIIVAEVSYETTSPTVDSQVVQIKSANPDIFMNIATPKFGSQAIKKIGELGWKPVQIIPNFVNTVAAVLKPAGLENAQGMLSSTFLKDPTDPAWKDDAAVKEYLAFMTKWYPEGDRLDVSALLGYSMARAFVAVIERCGDDLTRNNIMKQMTSLNMPLDIYLPGVTVRTSSSDYAPIDQVQMMRFEGESWRPFGPLIGSEVSK